MKTDNLLKEMLEFRDPIAAINYALKLYGQSPTKPSKPYLSKEHSVKEVLDYAVELEAYLKDIDDYKTNGKNYLIWKQGVEKIIMNYIEEVTGVNTKVPEQYRENLRKKAQKLAYLSDSGYDISINYYNELDSMISVFE